MVIGRIKADWTVCAFFNFFFEDYGRYKKEKSLNKSLEIKIKIDRKCNTP